MTPLDAKTVQEIALIFHDYPISPDRAGKLAEEVNLYLESIERLRQKLSFDDAPADFDRYLRSFAER